MSQSSTVYVYTISAVGKVGSWSRYIFPFKVEDITQLGTDIYLRAGDEVYLYDQDAVDDEGTDFETVIQWPWLDMGSPGQTKRVIGFDIAGSGDVSVEFGYQEGSFSTFTTPFTVEPDTLPGGIIPLSVSAPSFSVRLTYQSSEAWTWDAMNIYLTDNRWTS